MSADPHPASLYDTLPYTPGRAFAAIVPALHGYSKGSTPNTAASFQVTDATGVSPKPFTLVVNTAQAVDPGALNLTLDTQFRLTLSNLLGGYDFTIAWGDGSVDHVTCPGILDVPVITNAISVPGASTSGSVIDVLNGNNTLSFQLSSVLHTYPASGVYTVEILQDAVFGFPAVMFQDPAGTSGSQKPLAIKQTDGYKVLEIAKWGNINWVAMTAAFMGCTNLQITATDTQHSRTAAVVSWDRAFTQCRALTHFPHVEMGGATDIRSIFNTCVSLVSIAPTLDWRKVTSLSYSFVACASLTSFPAFEFPSVTSISNAWRSCSGLTSFPAIDFPNATSALNTWDGCTSMATFGECTFPKVTSFSNAWNGCSALTSFPALDFPLVTSLSGAWRGCTSLTSFNIPFSKLPVVTSLAEAWKNCQQLSSLPMDDIPTVTSLSGTFADCPNMKLSFSAWTPYNVTTAANFLQNVDINVPASPTDYVSQSRAFDNAVWTKTLVSVQANAVGAPTGNNTAEKLRPTSTSSADHSVSQNVTVVVGTLYTVYCCFKAIELTYGRLVLSNAFAADLYVNLSDGSVISSSGGTAYVDDIGDGWYRLRIEGVVPVTTTLNVKIQAFDNATLSAFAGNSVLGIGIWTASVIKTAVGSTANYDALLTSWVGWSGGGGGSPTKTLKNSVALHAGNSKYSIVGDSAYVRKYLAVTKSWTFTDGGPI